MQDRGEHEGSEDAGNPNESDYESSSDGQRPGRFYGPDSSWRYYTQDERALTASLQQSESNDLSLALYNVHAMRVRARGPQSISTAQPWHSRSRWVQPNQDGVIPFQPPPKWTAWPLKPEAVPRTREVWGVSAAQPSVEAGTYSNPEPWKPSLNLQEELKAGLLRQAKDRFNKRQQEDDYSHESQSRPAASSDEISYFAEDEGQDEEQTESIDTQSEHAALSTPLFMADDDVASIILQPTVRHMISKYDDLLTALHQSRRGHRIDHTFSTRAKRRTTSRSGSVPHIERSTKSSRKRKRVVSDAVQLDAKIAGDPENLEGNTQPARKWRGHHRKLAGQRDWSEVLGIAALSGWEPSVIDRAARRCAAIFGETMSMRFMAGNITDPPQDKLVEYIPDMIPPVEEVDTPVKEEEVEEAFNVNACPHISCKRHNEPYELRWRLREHLKREHRYSAKELEEWKAQAIDRDHRATAMAVSSSEDEGDEDRDNDAEGLDPPNQSEQDGFLQPITIRIGRSRDKRPRASASRSHSRRGG